MNYLNNIQLLFFVLSLSGCIQKNSLERDKIGSYENVKNQLNETKVPELNPKADIRELEMEINNGGFNQYFINSGQNCYETLKLLKQNGKDETARLLESAINLINPNHMPENDFTEKLRKRKVEELYNDEINAELYKLDIEFYKYKDGSLTKE